MFDQMHVDAWEPESSIPRVAASFSRSSDEIFPAILHGDAADIEGGPVNLLLVRPTYSISAAGPAVEMAFFASIDKPVLACSADHVTQLDGQVEITQQIAEAGGLSAFLGASKITLKHIEQPNGTQFDFLLPPSNYKLPALHLDHHVNWLERGVDAVGQFLVSLFVAGRFECPLNGVVVRILRPADMLYLHFSFSGLKLKMHAGKPFLEQQQLGNGKGKVARSSITVHFPPQNLQEESFYELADGSVQGQPPQPKVKTSSSGPTRLKFTIPPSAFDRGLPFSVETLLGWDRFVFQQGANSRGKDGTRIEVPYRLYVTPSDKATFLHDVTPRTVVEAIPDITLARTEVPAVWGTLLQDGNRRARQGYDATPVSMTAFGAGDVVEIVQLQVVELNKIHAYYAEPLKFSIGDAYIYAAGKSSAIYAGDSPKVKITAILPSDTKFPCLQGVEYTFTGNSPTKSAPVKPDFSLWLVQAPTGLQIGGVKLPPMAATDRAQIIVLSSGEPATPIHVNRLTLTSLGAWFDADSKWDTTQYPALHLDLSAWRHITVLGRDEYVQVEHEGYLWPFGHRAALITRTQRVFYSVFPVDTCGDDKIFCYLRQQKFIHVKEPLKNYPDGRQIHKGRDLPFASVVITTDTTPPLDPPGNSYFFPEVTMNHTTNKFKFDLMGYDWAVPATAIPFKAPLIFVPNDDNLQMAGELAAIQSIYHNDGDDCIGFGGQHIHFAASERAGDTDLKAQNITFCGMLMETQCTTTCAEANFYPSLASASVDIPAVQVLGGVGDTYSNVKFHPKFVSTGYGTPQSNPTEIFLQVLPKPDGTGRNLGFPGQHGGGLAVPTMPISNVSRKNGATSIDIDAKLNLDPFFKTILSGAFPKLFGVVPLFDIVAFGNELHLDQLPAVIPNLVDGAAVAYQHLNDIARDATTVIEATQTLLKMSREQAAKQCVQLLLAPKVREELTKLVPDTLKTSFQDVQSTVVRARSDLNNKLTALKQDEIKKLDQLSASAESSFQNVVSSLVNQIGAAIVQAIDTLTLDLFQLEELFSELNKIVLEFKSVEFDALTQLKTIESALQAFSKDQVVQCIIGSCSDIQTQIKLLLTSILQGEMQLLVGRVSTEIVQQVAAPVVALQIQVDNALDQYSSAQQAAFAAAVQATAGLSDNAIKTLNDAEETYTAAINEAQAKLSDAVAIAENSVADQVASVINDQAVNGVVTAVMADAGPVLAQINQVKQQVQDAIKFIDQVLPLVDALEDLLGAPIEYGVDYKLPPVALHNAGIFLANADTRLQIDAQINVKNPALNRLNFDPKIDYRVAASINDFGIDLLQPSGDADFLTIWFDHVTFTTRSDEHPQVDCRVKTVEFGAALAFVQGLFDAFNPMKSGKSGPLITLTGDGLAIGYGFSFPDMEGGGFQITGLFLGVQVSLSFNGGPMRMRFYFARPEKHFLMSAGIYGGGGYLILEGGPKSDVQPGSLGGSSGGIDAFQLCMEFGATVALELDVASGEVHLLGGIYIALSGGQCALTGFIRAGGSLNVLGIVTMSIEWYIGLTWNSGGSVTGHASVTVSISIAFFSVSATLSMDWTWAGSPPPRQAASLKGLRQPDTIEPVAWRNPARSPVLMIADYDPVSGADQQSTPPCGPPDSPVSRMKHINREIWDTYASAFARVPNS